MFITNLLNRNVATRIKSVFHPNGWFTATSAVIHKCEIGGNYITRHILGLYHRGRQMPETGHYAGDGCDDEFVACILAAANGPTDGPWTSEEYEVRLNELAAKYGHTETPAEASERLLKQAAEIWPGAGDEPFELIRVENPMWGPAPPPSDTRPNLVHPKSPRGNPPTV